MKEPSEQREYAVPAVDRMLDIVEFLVEHQRPFGITELARTLGIPTNSVFRILRRLAERGYVETDADSGGYQLGFRFLSLGMRLSHRCDLRTRARPHLEALAAAVEETVQMQVRERVNLLVLDVVPPPIEYFVQVVPGSRADFHCSAMGKCLLAFMDAEELRAVLPAELPRFSENTITSWPKLRRELAEVRRTGVAYDREEHMRGIFCVASPVFDVNEHAAAGMGVTGLAGRVDESRKKAIAQRVFETAAGISCDLGYAGDYFLRINRDWK